MSGLAIINYPGDDRITPEMVINLQSDAIKFLKNILNAVLRTVVSFHTFLRNKYKERSYNIETWHLLFYYYFCSKIRKICKSSRQLSFSTKN